MRISSLAAIMIVTTVILSACGQDKMASVDDHSSQFFGRQGVKMISGLTPPATTYVAPAFYQPAHPVVYQTSSIANDRVTSSDLAPPKSNSTPPASPRSTVASMMNWQWPVDGHVVESFGSQGHGVVNEGVTIAAQKGTPIHAAAPGEVVFVGNQLKDYGNMVILRHPDGEMSAYSHASEVIVAKGDHMKQGDVLGYVGQSGNALQPELHFAVRANDRPIDPMTKFPAQVASN